MSSDSNASKNSVLSSKDEIDLSLDSEDARLEWVQLMAEMRMNVKPEENFLQKSVRKFRENPLIPIGVAATTYCLTRGLFHMVTGDAVKQQNMMRGRVGFQAFTIAVFGISAVVFPYMKNKKS